MLSYVRYPEIFFFFLLCYNQHDVAAIDLIIFDRLAPVIKQFKVLPCLLSYSDSAKLSFSLSLDYILVGAVLLAVPLDLSARSLIRMNWFD